KKGNMQIYNEPLNPYSMTLKKGLQHLKHQFQARQYYMSGEDELVNFKCEFDKCEPPIPSNTNEDVLLDDIYTLFPHYPNMQVHWKIEVSFIVPYKRTIDIGRNNLPKNVPFQDISLNQKTKFNPLLYECDLHRLKLIEDTVFLINQKSNSGLQLLLHEVIKNGFLHDLIIDRLSISRKKIKKQINYNEKNPNELILNDLILTILNELKILYHDDIHKQMGYPLQLHQICAILLYCGKSCNENFSYEQIQFRHHNWPYLDGYMQEAIRILHKHERREENEMEVYCGLKNVRLENIKEIKSGFFISHVSTSDDIQVAQMYRSHQGCILHFHPSMRRSNWIDSCDVSWISPFKHEREILFSRSFVGNFDERKHTRISAWNAKVESEDEYTQMILLTWTRYDQFIQQTMNISKILNHSMDLNLIYTILVTVKENMFKYFIFI
ncbi:hypothetical protein RFI_02447, partial [Reticulomyxa filosa]